MAAPIVGRLGGGLFGRTLPRLSGVVHLSVNNKGLPALGTTILPASFLQLGHKQALHTSSTQNAWEKPSGPRRWLLYNNDKFPPQAEGEERRPAYVCHMKTNIKYSPKKMWYVACLVRGMTIDEAIKQLQFIQQKGATAVRETLEEAQALAVKEHNVEFKSNLWVAESFVSKGPVIKGFRRHARKRVGEVKYKHCHYMVRLEEGKPPEHYYHYRRDLTPQEMLEQWLDDQRKRTIIRSL
ncbi:mitochondrial ribosomal protein L22 [Oratosquilla oratoria]|uniref:mitochondrial ribosomal protein L22 n=1 Tax=Oratosquilla oratoria TaxID=337810 RepID=UPI003F75C599